MHGQGAEEGHLIVGNQLAKFAVALFLCGAFWAFGPPLHAEAPLSPPFPQEGSGNCWVPQACRAPLDASLLQRADAGQAVPDEDDDSLQDKCTYSLHVVQPPGARPISKPRFASGGMASATPWVPGRSALLRKRVLKKP